MELLRIDFEKGVLKTPNHEYFIASSLSVDRYIEFELMQAAVAYGCTFAEVHKSINDIKDALNKVKFVEAAAILANFEQALKQGVDKKKHIVLRMAALFLNEKDEDVRTYKTEVIDAKIADWLESGVDYHDFFQLTLSLVPGLLNVLEQTLKGILSSPNESEQPITSATDKVTSESSGQ